MPLSGTPDPGMTADHLPPAVGDVAGSIGQVAAAGVPLAAGLRAYSLEVPSWRQGSTLRRISQRLEKGVSLEDAINDAGAATPAYLRGLVVAAQRSGNLANALNRHLFALRRTGDIRWRLWLLLAYPFVLLGVAIGVVLLLLVWATPSMKAVFEDFGMPLPRPTLWTVYASDAVLFLLPYWPWILLVCLMIAGAFYGLRFVPGREFRTRLWQKIPLVGGTARSVGLSEFCSLLGLLVENRMPLPEALRLTATALRDPNLKEGTRVLADQVERGIAPYDEVQRMPQFARSLAPLFRWTDRPDALAEGLRASAELYAMQARVQSGVMGAVIQPILLAMVILLAGGMFVSLFSPIIALLQSLT